MTIKKEDVQKALTDIEKAQISPTVKDDVEKGGDNGGFTSPNGAADGSGDDSSLKAPGEDMNDKYGNKKEKSKTKKSLSEEFEKDQLDASSFLKSLVEGISTHVNGLTDVVAKSDAAMEERSTQLSEEILEIQKSLGNVGIVLKAVCDRIGVFENEPARVQKSVTSDMTDVQPVEKSFENNLKTIEGGSQDSIYKSLNGKSPRDMKKSISAAMFDLVKKGELKDVELISFEQDNVISPEADVKLRAILNN